MRRGCICQNQNTLGITSVPKIAQGNAYNPLISSTPILTSNTYKTFNPNPAKILVTNALVAIFLDRKLINPYLIFCKNIFC